MIVCVVHEMVRCVFVYVCVCMAEGQLLVRDCNSTAVNLSLSSFWCSHTFWRIAALYAAKPASSCSCFWDAGKTVHSASYPFFALIWTRPALLGRERELVHPCWRQLGLVRISSRARLGCRQSCVQVRRSESLLFAFLPWLRGSCSSCSCVCRRCYC